MTDYTDEDRDWSEGVTLVEGAEPAELAERKNWMADIEAGLKEPGQVVKYRQEKNEYLPVIIDANGDEVDVTWAPMPGMAKNPDGSAYADGHSSQWFFLNAPEFEALYEGTRGPGKTLTLIMDFCRDVGQGWDAEWKGMIIRKTYPDLADAINMSKKWIPRMFPGAFYNEIKYFWRFPKGELLYFRPIATADDYWQHHGTNYTWLGWEELTQWADNAAFLRMQSVVRSSIKGIPKRVRATTNPSGRGHNWVQARYNLYNWPEVVGKDDRGDIYKIAGPLISNAVDEEGIPEPPRRAYHGSLRENIILMNSQPQYVSQLKMSARNDSELKAWLYGSWDISSGGMFDDIWATHRGTIVVPEFDIPPTWSIRRAYDHGSTKPWSCGWYAYSDGSDVSWRNAEGKVVTRATLPGDMFRVGELYGWQKDQENVGRRQLIPDIKKEILEYEINRNWRDPNTGQSRVKRGPADTSIFAEEDGRPSVASDFESPCIINGHRWKGIIWEHADKKAGSREQGWEQCRKRLKATMRPKGGIREEKGLFIVGPRCPQWLRTVPKLPRDEKKLDDVDCWVAGTLIATPTGECPIEEIQVGDLVETPIGPRPVLKSYVSGPSETQVVQLSDGKVLEGTPHHKIQIHGHGLVALSDLVCYMTPQERIISCLAQKSLSIAVSFIAGIQGGSTTSRAAQFCREAAQAFIDRCGLMLEMRYLTAGMSTTRTMTTTITGSGTLNACRRASTLDTISLAEPTLWSKRSESGDSRQPGKSYSAPTWIPCYDKPRDVNLRAEIVASLLRLDTLASYIARLNAAIPPGARDLLKNCVQFAVRSFGRSLTATRKSVPVHINAVGHSAVRKLVYNLTVADAHMFYANGVLSSNTESEDHIGDEMRYMLRFEAGEVKSYRR
jgi:hypothetical protein